MSHYVYRVISGKREREMEGENDTLVKRAKISTKVM
jgi:hypothetical protein